MSKILEQRANPAQDMGLEKTKAPLQVTACQGCTFDCPGCFLAELAKKTALGETVLGERRERKTAASDFVKRGDNLKAEAGDKRNSDKKVSTEKVSEGRADKKIDLKSLVTEAVKSGLKTSSAMASPASDFKSQLASIMNQTRGVNPQPFDPYNNLRKGEAAFNPQTPNNIETTNGASNGVKGAPAQNAALQSVDQNLNRNSAALSNPKVEGLIHKTADHIAKLSADLQTLHRLQNSGLSQSQNTLPPNYHERFLKLERSVEILSRVTLENKSPARAIQDTEVQNKASQGVGVQDKGLQGSASRDTAPRVTVQQQSLKEVYLQLRIALKSRAEVQSPEVRKALIHTLNAAEQTLRAATSKASYAAPKKLTKSRSIPEQGGQIKRAAVEKSVAEPKMRKQRTGDLKPKSSKDPGIQIGRVKSAAPLGSRPLVRRSVTKSRGKEVSRNSEAGKTNRILRRSVVRRQKGPERTLHLKTSPKSVRKQAGSKQERAALQRASAATAKKVRLRNAPFASERITLRFRGEREVNPIVKQPILRRVSEKAVKFISPALKILKNLAARPQPKRRRKLSSRAKRLARAEERLLQLRRLQRLARKKIKTLLREDFESLHPYDMKKKRVKKIKKIDNQSLGEFDLELMELNQAESTELERDRDYEIYEEDLSQAAQDLELEKSAVLALRRRRRESAK